MKRDFFNVILLIKTYLDSSITKGNNMIKIKELSKSYNNENILNNINITIKPGEIYGIIGQSGAGKSTLLRCINGLEEIDSGSLIVNGIEPTI